MWNQRRRRLCLEAASLHGSQYQSGGPSSEAECQPCHKAVATQHLDGISNQRLACTGHRKWWTVNPNIQALRASVLLYDVWVGIKNSLLLVTTTHLHPLYPILPAPKPCLCVVWVMRVLCPPLPAMAHSQCLLSLPQLLWLLVHPPPSPYPTPQGITCWKKW